MSKAKNNKAVRTVLFNLQLQQYLPTFQKHNIDLKTFLTMNEQTLQSIGILNETHRRILVVCIRKLSHLLITTATINLIEELDERLLTPITEETPEISSDDRSHDFMVPDDKSDKCALVKTDPPPAYTVEPQEMNILSLATPLISNTKSNNRTFSKRLSLLIQGSVTSEEIDSKDSNDSNRRHSMPVLPSYVDAVKGQKINTISTNPSEKEYECEELPSYSCTVQRAGYLVKKDETRANGLRASDRSWRKFYMHLWGTFVRIYKSEPLDINHVPPVFQFSMNKAIVSFAVDYTKRRNVFRIHLPTGHRYLFQTANRTDCISWIETLQSSANISSTIDDREMPMFITLPVRRRRRATTMPTSSSADQSRAYPFMAVTSSGLTYQYFNEIARELQQVQVIDVLPEQQLLW